MDKKRTTPARHGGFAVLRSADRRPLPDGRPQIEKVGFAEIPVAFVTVACPSKAISAIVPVVRQFVFRELEAAGIENEILAFIPTVQDERRVRFVDCNEHSPTKGKNKMGRIYRFAFEIKPPFVGYFQWGGFGNRVGTIPERPETK